MANERTIIVDLTPLTEYCRRLGTMGAETAGFHLGNAYAEVGLYIERDAKLRAPVGAAGSAGLKGSIVADRIGTGLGTEVDVGVGVEYGEPVEFGRTGGPPRPPVEPIALWARRKLGLGEEEALEFAYAFSAQVAQGREIPSHEFLGPAVDLNEDAFNGIMDRAVERACVSLAGL